MTGLGHTRKNSGGAYRVRFTPKERSSSGHAGSAAWGTEPDSCTAANRNCYSTTSSARERRDYGTVMPSALADVLSAGELFGSGLRVARPARKRFGLFLTADLPDVSSLFAFGPKATCRHHRSRWKVSLSCATLSFRPRPAIASNPVALRRTVFREGPRMTMSVQGCRYIKPPASVACVSCFCSSLQRAFTPDWRKSLRHQSTLVFWRARPVRNGFARNASLAIALESGRSRLG
jgi:hypothetical protein